MANHSHFLRLWRKRRKCGRTDEQVTEFTVGSEVVKLIALIIIVIVVGLVARGRVPPHVLELLGRALAL